MLMLTGEADEDLAFRLMRAGALDYLAKAEATPSSLARAIRYAEARRGFQAELDEARREAEAKSLELDTLNRQKTLLFSIIAHDLRNPFQSLLGLSEVLGKAVATRDHASIERRAKGINDAATQAYAPAGEPVLLGEPADGHDGGHHHRRRPRHGGGGGHAGRRRGGRR